MENIQNTEFTFALPKGNSSIIKVIGVGGGGNNALKHMYEKGIHGVDFVICNTDSQTLDNNPVSNKVQLGATITEGLGAGADPEVGEKAAIESIDDIKAALGQNTKMVFITAGMGGGTGTGAAPVIAKVAKEMGILTIGIVTVPFSFEGKRRLEQAEIGLNKLRENVDSLIVINNDKLRQQFGNLGFKQGFSKADEVLTNAAKGMAEVITGYFDVNIDFRDAKSVLQNSGTALMSTGIASGENKAEEAVKKALDSPLLNDNKITGAKNVLLLIRSGSEEVTMDEIGTIMDHIQKEAGNTADIIFGVGTDEELGDQVSVLVIATGFAKDNHKNTGPTEKIKLSLEDQPGNNFTKEKISFPNNTDISEKKLLHLEDINDTSSFVVNDSVNTTNEINELKIFEKESSSTELQQNSKTENLSLFSLDDDYLEDLQPQSFSFEVDDNQPKNKSNEQEPPTSFSFFVNEPIDNSNQKTSDEVAIVNQKKAHEDNNVLAENQANNGTETNTNKKEELPTSEKIEDLFTFIDKPVPNEKIQDRRNKLKQFNTRYKVSETENLFESVPAFRRKNIQINEEKPSEQQMNSFLFENENGEFKIRENKFLNKDVD